MLGDRRREIAVTETSREEGVEVETQIETERRRKKRVLSWIGKLRMFDL